MYFPEPRPLAPITQMPCTEEAWRHIPLSLIQLLGAPHLALAAGCTDTHEWFYIHIRARKAAPPTSNTPGTYERQRRYLTLYFSEVTGEIHGPMHFAPDERVEQIQQWLETYTFRSRCVDEETNDWLVHAEISTSCGMVLDHWRNLDEYPVCDGDTLTVIVVPKPTVHTRYGAQGARCTVDTVMM